MPIPLLIIGLVLILAAALVGAPKTTFRWKQSVTAVIATLACVSILGSIVTLILSSEAEGESTFSPAAQIEKACSIELNAAQEKLVNAACSDNGKIRIEQGGFSAAIDPDTEPVSLGYVYAYGSVSLLAGPLASEAYEIFLQTDHFPSNNGKMNVSAIVSVRASDGKLVSLYGGNGVKKTLEAYEEHKAMIAASNAERASSDDTPDVDGKSGE